ncbi:hypothetical protein SASPL_156438 [Salvia splendens]|uniref:Germin-like protein n=1 Tax=Salvia splendens TaxID=180675 RepID=A0A8X8VWP2_SALSN|nr:hypothetical protein SASPL_156438 [Salvia splendens]
MTSISLVLSLLALLNFVCIVFAFDVSPLQDFCVADSTGKALCKDPSTVTPNDFFRSGLHLPGNTSNPYGAAVVTASAATVPGLNGLGLTFMRADLAPNGFFPPHFHSRATELVVVLEGSMEVGFITSYPSYKYYSKILGQGDVFVVPVGLVHNVRNLAKGNSVALVAFNSQNPGLQIFQMGSSQLNLKSTVKHSFSNFQLFLSQFENLQFNLNRIKSNQIKLAMSMSMFSTFDALCGEKLGFSLSSRSPAAAKIDDLKKTKGDEGANSSSTEGKDRRTKRAPRFAVEFDGLNCFETIVPY